MKTFLYLMLAIALSACAGVQQSINAFEASSLVAARAADDNAIHVWSTAGCAFPLSAILRNPQVIPSIKALCIPSGATQVLP